MARLTISTLGVMALGGVALALYPTDPARAQDEHQCPNGAGPGEEIAYRTPDSPGVAGIFFCRYIDDGASTGDSGGSDEPAAEDNPYTRYGPPAVWAAVAMGPDGSIHWSAEHQYYDDAENAALAVCKRDMKQRTPKVRGKCSLLAKDYISWFAVATRPGERPAIATNRRRKTAIEEAMGQCGAQDCELSAVFKADGIESDGAK